MYLSRLLLTGERFRNPYEIHRALWSVFSETPDQARDFLFRVEHNSIKQTQVIMQSLREPSCDSQFSHILASKPFRPNLPENCQFRFLLVANPVKTITDDQGRLNNKGEIKKCRVPLIKDEDQLTWLKRRFNKSVIFNALEIEKQMPLHFRKGSKPGKIQPYAFKGILQVKDSSTLETLLQHGIGPAKAFGCGLLSLAPFR